MLKRLLCVVLLLTGLTTSALAETLNVTLHTNKGDITLELFPSEAPVTVQNFLNYVDSGFYEGTIFHRTIAGFMIQGGGFDQELNRKETNQAIKNESGNGLSNLKGTISMARTNHPHSATSQFFINTVNNRNLDARGARHGYAVFGRVIEGMDLVVNIGRSPTERKNGFRDVPKSPIIIEKVTRNQ